MRLTWCYSLLLFGSALLGQMPGPYAPAVGQPGSLAIAKDSSLIRAWANNCSVMRGYWDIERPALDTVTFGQAPDAEGPADGLVVSLGDSGVATYQLAFALSDQNGPEFAIFENSFSDQFLELAFVEVSSDGQNFVRFPANSLVQDSSQTVGFGSTDPTLVHNFAGKYRADFGVPFDLKDLKDSSGLNLAAITHIRIVDVIGAIGKPYSSKDAFGNEVNDPYPTAYASGGFDLDALALLHPANNLSIKQSSLSVEAHPNPAQNAITWNEHWDLGLLELSGRLLIKTPGNRLNLEAIPNGIYYLKGSSANAVHYCKIQVQH